jgi:secondary thiamine-phosphate synthase enzyme
VLKPTASPATDRRRNGGAAEEAVLETAAHGDGWRPICLTASLHIRTGGSPQFIDITDQVEELLRRSGVRTGFAVIFSRHTTAAIRINESEPQLLRDMELMLERVAPRDSYYHHNDLSIRTVNLTEEEDANGHAHCRHFLMGASEAVPVIDGRLHFGRWQRLFLVELDRPREREVVIQFVGS